MVLSALGVSASGGSMRTSPHRESGATSYTNIKARCGAAGMYVSVVGAAETLVRCHAERPSRRWLPARGLQPALTQQDAAGPGLSLRHQLVGPQAAVT